MNINSSAFFSPTPFTKCPVKFQPNEMAINLFRSSSKTNDVSVYVSISFFIKVRYGGTESLRANLTILHSYLLLQKFRSLKQLDVRVFFRKVRICERAAQRKTLNSTCLRDPVILPYILDFIAVALNLSCSL